MTKFKTGDLVFVKGNVAYTGEVRTTFTKKCEGHAFVWCVCETPEGTIFMREEELLQKHKVLPPLVPSKF